MTKHTTVLANLLSPLSRSVFQNEVEAYHADKWTKSLKTYDMFKTLCYGQLSGCYGVREITGSLAANAKRLYHAGLKPVKRSTLCDAMAKRDHRIFQGIFHYMVELAERFSAKAKKKFGDPLRILDATTMPVCLEKMPWAKFRKAKGAVKMHALLDGDSLLPAEVVLTAGNVHEVERMHWLCQESGVIYVMDRGYVDYKSLYIMELQESTFVTRMKNNCAKKTLKYLPHKKDSGVLSDTVIALNGPQSKNHYPKPMRRIRYYDTESERTYDFITNNFNKAAEEIAAIYKERWQVELFFKWLKQNLKVKTFWGTSKNAVYTQIWVALILSVLVWLNKAIHGITNTVHEMMQKLKTTLICKGTLLELCADIPPPFKEYSLQPLLEGFL